MSIESVLSNKRHTKQTKLKYRQNDTTVQTDTKADRHGLTHTHTDRVTQMIKLMQLPLGKILHNFGLKEKKETD